MVNHDNLDIIIHKMMVKVINDKMGRVIHNMEEVEAINNKGVVEVDSNIHLKDISNNLVLVA